MSLVPSRLFKHFKHIKHINHIARLSITWKIDGSKIIFTKNYYAHKKKLQSYESIFLKNLSKTKNNILNKSFQSF